MVLDEATTALEASLERAILENIRHRRCSCILIAHRPETVQNSDEIIVLKGGRVARRGTYEEIMCL